MPNDTIYALSSAPGRAAIAVVRVSGPSVRAVLAGMVDAMPQPRIAALRTISHPRTNEPIDQALVLFFAAPASETGEDVAEFQIHGGRAVLQALFDALATFDSCRMAEPGEFARRAFDNGKLDLTAAEGIADLVDAETEAQRRQARLQADGALARLYDDWRRRLIEAQALVEAAIDFSDEGDVGDKAYAQAHAIAAPLRVMIGDHLAGADRGEIIRGGFRVVIAGPPNAGKSSLLNALARRDAAIVSDEAGTTRDVVEVHLDLDGLPVIVSDTAGVREAANKVEREGIRRTIDRATHADLVLWLHDAIATAVAAPPAAIATADLMHVRNKIDVAGSDTATAQAHDISISAKTGAGVGELITAITERAASTLAAGDAVVPTNARHRQYLTTALGQLDVFLAHDISDTDLLELRAEDLRIAATALGRLTGRIDVEDILDQIFSRFCIGK